MSTGLKEAKQWAVSASAYSPYSDIPTSIWGRDQSIQWAELSEILLEIAYALDKHFPRIYIFTNSWLGVNGLFDQNFSEIWDEDLTRTNSVIVLSLCPLIIQHLAKQTTYHHLERKAAGYLAPLKTLTSLDLQRTPIELNSSSQTGQHNLDHTQKTSDSSSAGCR